MKTKLLLVSLILAASAPAQTVLQGVISLDSSGTFGPFMGEYSLTIPQDAGQTDYTSIWFDKSENNLLFRNTNLDEGSDWFFVSEDQIFSHEASGSSFSSYDTSYPIPLGTFYLGVSTGIGFGDDWTPNRTVRGWALLQNSASGIELLSSAVAYDAVSIQIGTTNAVAIPEPAAFGFIAASGGIAVALYRRRRK